jgi:hypothetical protein
MWMQRENLMRKVERETRAKENEEAVKMFFNASNTVNNHLKDKAMFHGKKSILAIHVKFYLI